MGQPGCGRRLPQPGQLTIGEELLGYHNNNFSPLTPIVCLFLPSDFLLFDVAPFLSVMHVYGMIYYHLIAISADI